MNNNRALKLYFINGLAYRVFSALMFIALSPGARQREVQGEDRRRGRRRRQVEQAEKEIW